MVTLRITSSVKPWNPVCRASCFIISVSTPKTRARVLEQNGCNRELSPVFGRNPKDEGLVSTIYLPSESSRFSSNTLSTVRKCSFSPPVVPLLRGFGEGKKRDNFLCWIIPGHPDQLGHACPPLHPLASNFHRLRKGKLDGSTMTQIDRAIHLESSDHLLDDGHIFFSCLIAIT